MLRADMKRLEPELLAVQEEMKREYEEAHNQAMSVVCCSISFYYASVAFNSHHLSL